MNVLRWPAIVLILAALVGLVVADRDTSTSAATDGQSAVVAGVAVPGTDRLASTWFCAGGTADEAGVGNQTLVLSNPTGRNMAVQLTVYPVVVETYEQPDLGATENVSELEVPPPTASRATPVVETVTLDANTTTQIAVADIEGAAQGAGSHAAVLIESGIGGLVVYHQVVGPQGAAMASCHTTASDKWTFASGTTRRGARQFITLFNPFPSDAVADISFAVDGRDRGRAPQVYRKLVVPAQSVLPVEITAVVTLFDSVSASVEVISGRLVADRMVEMTRSETEELGVVTRGLSISPGNAATADQWVFPVSHVGEDVVDAIVIYNPSEFEARVSVEVYTDDGVTIEPFGLAVRPGSTEIVALGPNSELIAQSRVVDGSVRLPAATGYWAAVRALNGVDITAERMTVSQNRVHATSFTGGGALTSSVSYLPMPGTGEVSGDVVIVNPSADAIATVQIQAQVDRNKYRVVTVEIGPGRRLVLSLDQLGLAGGALLIFTSTEPVVVEADLAIEGSTRVPVLAVPAADSAEPIDLPLGN